MMTLRKFHIHIIILMISMIALSAAFIAQYGFQILPCNLCLYQRYPYAIVILLALIGLAYQPARLPTLILCTLAFFGNAALALYHVGVEQHWWASMFEGCKVTFDSDATLDQIMATPSVPCDKPAWLDPIFGMSMAVYNMLVCLGMSVFCFISIKKGRT